ncbi:hypothetical protein KW410_10230 [Vibrio fluvialis]|uniref:hypothetical protein n=1 Tax=Vibrio sp. LQ2 TaxID=2883075 RepID=UPI001C9DE954|nr:hypothetical protein [Vibrio sp. LQ2]MBY7786544.1 hypothetical protein [Vibrio fluvialis]USP06018.1 hypothetical protein LGV68_01545 [Vibrio sp. LQ2]
MNQSVWETVDIDVPWIFIPLHHDDARKIYFWIKRWGYPKDKDELLATECEGAIRAAFEKLELQFDTETLGEIKMENMRLYSGSDGIAIPESCFINPSTNLTRLDNPLKPLNT